MMCSICRKEWNAGHFPQECRDEVAKQRDEARDAAIDLREAWIAHAEEMGCADPPGLGHIEEMCPWLRPTG